MTAIAPSGANSMCGYQPNPNGPSLACPAPPTGPGGQWVSDSFYFVHQPLAGNGSLTVRMTSLTGLYASHPGFAAAGGSPTAGMMPGLEPWSKAGIIIKAGCSPPRPGTPRCRRRSAARPRPAVPPWPPGPSIT